ncbi:hypothetical protein HD554DRAFT_2133669 [Boletus coccyginus]|nr:hypothetical protein HD554DRAFT_2133669 [Boletus coccyginus]
MMIPLFLALLTIVLCQAETRLFLGATKERMPVGQTAGSSSVVRLHGNIMQRAPELARALSSPRVRGTSGGRRRAA